MALSIISYLLAISTLIPSTVKNTDVDLGRLYYLELEYSGNKYYTLYGNYAMIDEELCIHFGAEQESLSLNSSEIMHLIANEKLTIYDNITLIHFANKAKHLPNQLFHLDQNDKISPNFFNLDKLKFTKLIGEGNPGEIYSSELLNESYNWYNEVKIDLLFSIYDGGICDYNFYGNKQFYEKEELQSWKKQLEELLSKSDHESHVEFISLTKKLYNSRLFYVGWCQS